MPNLETSTGDLLKMRKKQKHDISFIDWGGKVVGAAGLLGMAAYIAGYFKFYFLYEAFNCLWVLKFHSIPDVVVNGSMDVFLCSITAIPLYFAYERSEDIDNNGRRIVGYTLFGASLSVGVGVGFFNFKLSSYIIELMIYGTCYLLYGVSIATIARHSAEEGSYQYLLISFLGFVFAAFFSSYLANDLKTFASVNEKGGFPYKVVSEEGGSAILVGSVNGNYLLRLCGKENRYKLTPTEKWTVELRGTDTCIVDFLDN